MFEAFKKNGNKLQHRQLSNLLKEVKPDSEQTTRNVLNKTFIRYRFKRVLGGSNDAVVVLPSPIGFVLASTGSLLSNLSNVSCDKIFKLKPFGRPTSTVIVHKTGDETILFPAKNEITEKSHTLKD